MRSHSFEHAVIGAVEIEAITNALWTSMLDLAVTRVEGAEEARRGRRFLTGCVHITGDWEGTVAVECSAELARIAAGRMFGVEPHRASPDEVQDALGELANITGGNLKNRLSGTCLLSIPSVTEGVDYTVTVRGARRLSEVHFTCRGEPLIVSVFRRGVR